MYQVQEECKPCQSFLHRPAKAAGEVRKALALIKNTCLGEDEALQVDGGEKPQLLTGKILG